MTKLNHDEDQEIFKNITERFLFAVLVSLVMSILIWNTLWNQGRDLVHTILELGGVCIGIATFLIIWNKREHESNVNDILGFGFLIASIFDFMHMYYYNDFVKNEVFRGELSLKFWLLGRFTEVIVLLIFSYSPYMKNVNKHFKMLEVIIIVCGLFYVLQVFPQVIPDLYNSQGVTTTKVAMEYLIILIAILSLIKARKNLYNDQIIKFEYLYLSILFIIPSEICFTLFKDSSSFWMVFGHILKVCSYYYLYKAVFKSLIDHPYNMLNENNQRLWDILNAIPIPIHTYNNEGKIDFANNKFQELFKCPKGKVIGLDDREVLKVIRKVGNEAEDTLHVKSNNGEGDTNNIIRTFLDLNGNELKVLINAFRIKSGTLVLLNDVRQEQEIKNLNLQAQIILNSVNIPTMIVDYNENIVACNNQFADLVEIEYKDIIGISVSELNSILNNGGQGYTVKFNTIDFKNKVNDFSIETPKGNKKHIQVTSSAISNIYNESIGRVSVVQDLTKVKEEQLKLINQEKLALLGQMGATIVHETRNFLTTIKGNSQLIELYTDDEKLKKYARKINTDTDEVNRIISDFLNLSKPRETELEEIAFNDLVSSIKSTIETTSLTNETKLILELDYDERYIYCDEIQIRQVILNMCKNAIEAMEQTQNPVLRVTTGINEFSKEVFIKISDNGKGIGSETIKKIGTPFFTTKKLGTGLGLNACYQIIKEHKGRIDIESEVGKGTTFTITIPYIDEDLEALT